jgi:hypothetical protein
MIALRVRGIGPTPFTFTFPPSLGPMRTIRVPQAGLVSTLALVVGLVACHRDSDSSKAAASASTSPTGGLPAASGATASQATGCLKPPFDSLMPFQSFDNQDIIRSVTVGGDQVFFRNQKDVFRAPLAGGAPSVISSTWAGSRPSIWVVGDRLVSQAPGEPTFLSSPKTGGAWSKFIDVPKEKLGGGRRIVAQPAISDGAAFYWIEDKPAAKGAPDSGSIRSVDFSGRTARTIYEATGELAEITKAGDRLVFTHVELSTSEDNEKPAAGGPGAKKSAVHGTHRGPRTLWSVPISGGKADKLARISNIGDVILLADGPMVYVAGFADEDMTKPGIFRIPVAGGAALEPIDGRTLNGQGFVYGDRLVMVGPGTLNPRAKVRPTADPFANLGIVVLTGPRGGNHLELTACIQGNYTTHAYAVAGKMLLISIFNDTDHTVGIVRVALP